MIVYTSLPEFGCNYFYSWWIAIYFILFYLTTGVFALTFPLLLSLLGDFTIIYDFFFNIEELIERELDNWFLDLSLIIFIGSFIYLICILFYYSFSWLWSWKLILMTNLSFYFEPFDIFLKFLGLIFSLVLLTVVWGRDTL